MSSQVTNTPEKAVKKRSKLNLGVIIFGLIFIYMVAIIISYFTKTHYSINEVSRGQIIDSDTFNALILRDEEVVSASRTGYINYFVSDSAKCAKNGNVCIIDASHNNESSGADDSLSVTSSAYSDIREYVMTYAKNYSDSSYDSIYTLDYEVGNVINNMVSSSNISNLSNMATNSNYTIMKSKNCGVISYTTDGYEGYTQDDVTEDLMNRSGYTKTQITAGSYVESGNCAYRIIKDDTWSLVIKPSDEQLEKLKSMESVTSKNKLSITFLKDDITADADVEFFENNGVTFVRLTLSSYMVRYCNDRFEDIEIVWNDQEGLKIPASSVVKKNFYKVPISYLISSEGTSETAIWIMTENGQEQLQPKLYKSDDETYFYIDSNAIDDGTTLVIPTTNETYTVDASRDTETLEGVYKVNSGYADFRRVQILCTYGDYCIVSEECTGSISLYDHILLNAASVEENQVIY